jgi:signal transduction histidine kinase
MATACAVAIALLFLQKREVASLVRQLGFIRKQNTRARPTLDNSYAGEMRQLALAINALIEQQQQQRTELAALDTEMRHALTNISHDLRTPLTSAVGYLQLLEDEKLSDDQRCAYTATARTKLESLTVMLDQLMAFSRLIEQGSEQRDMEQVNLSSLLRTSLAIWYDDLRLAGFEVETDIPEQPVLVIANSESLQRIIQNLVGNTLAHGYGLLRVSLVVGGAEMMHADGMSAGWATNAEATASNKGTAGKGVIDKSAAGKVMADKSAADKGAADHNWAIMSFANRIAEPDALQAERLFNRFYTADVSRSGKGTGLGLAIVRSLAVAYGGNAAVRQDGDLLEISVTLPVSGFGEASKPL